MYSGYGGYDHFGSPKNCYSFNHVVCKTEFIVLTGTLNIPTDDEPQPFVIFVSNGSGTDTDETDSETDIASEGKVDSDVIDLKTDTASEGKVWDSCRIFCIENLKYTWKLYKKIRTNNPSFFLKNKRNKQNQKGNQRKKKHY